MPGGVNPTNGTKGPSRPEAPLGYGYVPGTSSNVHGNANYQVLAKYPPGPVPVFVPAQPSAQLVGVKNAYLVHTESVNTNPLTPGPAFTTTTFDTTSRADSAKILLHNGATAQMAITSCGIFGQKIHQLSGTSGFIHDKYVNYESIAIDGDRLLQIGNNMICTLAQVNQIADIQWKRNKVKRHIYTVTIPGTLTYFEPGEWYTLVVGSAGTQENINSLVECYSVRISHGVSDVGTTQIDFREVLQNWKFDSNETARFISAGGFNRKPTNKVLTIASSTYVGQADFYCDGTADDVEINNAINLLTISGGTILLTEGTFTTTNIVNMFSGITLQGSGSGGTTISVGASIVAAIFSNGPGGAHYQRVGVKNLNVKEVTPGNITGSAIRFVNSDYSVAEGNNIVSTTVKISIENCQYSSIRNNQMSGGSATGINVANTPNPPAYNEIVSNHCISSLIGINLTDTNYNIVSGNQCVGNSSKGINISSGTSNSITNNYCYNNGADTGIANTNGNNFSDAGTDTQFSG